MILLGNGVVANVVLQEPKETIQAGSLLLPDGHLPFWCSRCGTRKRSAFKPYRNAWTSNCW
jgi:hypothetical protein